MAVLAIRRSASTPTISIGAQGGGGAYSPIGASFDAVYTQNLYSDFGVSSTAAAIHSVTRASTKYVEDTSGLWTSVSANTLARSNKGVLIEESRTNSIRNNSMQGAGVGVAPTNWGGFGTGSGVTFAVVGTATENGIDCLDISVTGLCTATSTARISLDSTTNTVATVGQTFTGSSFGKLISGSLLASTVGVELREYNSGAPSGGLSNSTLALGATLARSSHTRTLTDAAATHLLQNYRIGLVNGENYNYVIRIGWPQLELGAFATSPIRTTSAAATRAADDVIIDPKYSSLAQGSAYVEWEEVPGPIGVNRRPFNMQSDSNNIIRFQIPSGNQINLSVTSASVSQASLGTTATILAGQTYKASMRWGVDDVAMISSLDNTLRTDTLAAMPTGANAITVGGFASNTMNGYLRRLTFYPRKLTDAELGALVA